MSALIQQTPYGVNHIGMPARTESGHSWRRVDTYVAGDGEVFKESRFVAGALDVSPMVTIGFGPDESRRKYHPKCSACWLGYSHSTGYHDQHGQGSWD